MPGYPSVVGGESENSVLQRLVSKLRGTRGHAVRENPLSGTKIVASHLTLRQFATDDADRRRPADGWSTDRHAMAQPISCRRRRLRGDEEEEEGVRETGKGRRVKTRQSKYEKEEKSGFRGKRRRTGR